MLALAKTLGLPQQRIQVAATTAVRSASWLSCWSQKTQLLGHQARLMDYTAEDMYLACESQQGASRGTVSEPWKGSAPAHMADLTSLTSPTRIKPYKAPCCAHTTSQLAQASCHVPSLGIAKTCAPAVHGPQ
jgi:hypothetical protein